MSFTEHRVKQVGQWYLSTQTGNALQIQNNDERNTAVMKESNDERIKNSAERIGYRWKNQSSEETLPQKWLSTGATDHPKSGCSQFSLNSQGNLFPLFPFSSQSRGIIFHTSIESDQGIMAKDAMIRQYEQSFYGFERTLIVTASRFFSGAKGNQYAWVID